MAILCMAIRSDLGVKLIFYCPSLASEKLSLVVAKRENTFLPLSAKRMTHGR